MAHAFLRLMILELLHGNLHSSLQLWEMKMPSCLQALIRKWAWNGIVLSRAWNNLFLTSTLSWMEMYINILLTSSKQVLFFLVKIQEFLGSGFEIIGPHTGHSWKFILSSFSLSLPFGMVVYGRWPFGARKSSLSAYTLCAGSVVWLLGFSAHTALYCLIPSWDPLPHLSKKENNAPYFLVWLWALNELCHVNR